MDGHVFCKDEDMMEDQDRKSDGRGFQWDFTVFFFAAGLLWHFTQARGLHHNEQHCICSLQLFFAPLWWRKSSDNDQYLVWLWWSCLYASLWGDSRHLAIGWSVESQTCLVGGFFSQQASRNNTGEMGQPFLKAMFPVGFFSGDLGQQKTPKCQLFPSKKINLPAFWKLYTTCAGSASREVFYVRPFWSAAATVHGRHHHGHPNQLLGHLNGVMMWIYDSWWVSVWWWHEIAASAFFCNKKSMMKTSISKRWEFFSK